MFGVYIAIAGLTITIVGLIIKLTVNQTEMRVWVEEMRDERKATIRALKRLPILEMRVGWIERKLDMSTPDVHEDPSHDAEE